MSVFMVKRPFGSLGGDWVTRFEGQVGLLSGPPTRRSSFCAWSLSAIPLVRDAYIYTPLVFMERPSAGTSSLSLEYDYLKCRPSECLWFHILFPLLQIALVPVRFTFYMGIEDDSRTFTMVEQSGTTVLAQAEAPDIGSFSVLLSNEFAGRNASWSVVGKRRTRDMWDLRKRYVPIHTFFC